MYLHYPHTVHKTIRKNILFLLDNVCECVIDDDYNKCSNVALTFKEDVSIYHLICKQNDFEIRVPIELLFIKKC